MKKRSIVSIEDLDPRVTTFKHKCILFGGDDMFVYDTFDEDRGWEQETNRHEDDPADHNGACCVDDGKKLEVRHYYDYDSLAQCMAVEVKYCPQCGYKR